jgi:AcrR family transcriptional regulator
MPKVNQQYLDARRAEIMDAAVACFARKGFHRATMRDIVRVSGLSPGAIYNLFKSKEEIIVAIASRRRDQERSIMEKALDEPTILDALRVVRDRFLGELKDPKERLRRRVSVQLWAEAQNNPAILKLVRRMFNDPHRLLTKMFSEAQRRGEVSTEIPPDSLARFLIGAFHGLVLQAEWNDRIPIEPQLRIFDLFIESAKVSTSRRGVQD